MSDPKIGELLHERREVRGLTLRAVAEQVGVSAPFWHDVERSRRLPGNEVLERACRVLGLCYSTLVQQAQAERATSRLHGIIGGCPRCGFPGPEKRRDRPLRRPSPTPTKEK